MDERVPFKKIKAVDMETCCKKRELRLLTDDYFIYLFFVTIVQHFIPNIRYQHQQLGFLLVLPVVA